jgi:UDPglucose--hexose-1-phosphate uridylyltransferase
VPELRKDPIIGRWVIISTERGKRPSDLVVEIPKSRGGFCPLCPGNEDKTPPEIFALRDNHTSPDTPGWTLRVVPNKFPALVSEGDLNKRGDGIYDIMNGFGVHEVIIETPDHNATASTLTAQEFHNILFSYRQRITELKKNKQLRYISLFKNYGDAAGASLEHPHSQLIALPVVPKRQLEEMAGAQTYFSYKERCIYCDIIRQELTHKGRVVLDNGVFLAIEPFAARFPFETWILPHEHISSFEDTPADKLSLLAELFSTVLKKINAALGFPPYNYILHTAPFDKSQHDYYHWHFEIIPRLTKVAGFEWGSGFYINPTPPEDAAIYLREA